MGSNSRNAGVDAAFDVANPTDEAAPASVEPERQFIDRTEPAAECVSVFVRESGVSIVVRNSAMTEHEALQSARRVSLELRGNGSALRELTLNGRVVYRHGAADAANRSSLLFAC